VILNNVKRWSPLAWKLYVGTHLCGNYIVTQHLNKAHARVAYM